MISDNNNDNLKFKKIKIQFYPEDEEKMRDMPIEECIQYKRKLKALNKYIRLSYD